LITSDFTDTREAEIFALIMFGFLVCRGSVYEKSELLFNVITAKNRGSNKEPVLNFNHPKFKLALKYLIFFSEILPKKFLISDGVDKAQFKSDGWKGKKIDWTHDKVREAEQEFEIMFPSIFEELVERIFKNNRTYIRKDDFVYAIDGTFTEKQYIQA